MESAPNLATHPEPCPLTPEGKPPPEVVLQGLLGYAVSARAMCRGPFYQVQSFLRGLRMHAAC